MKQTTPLLLSEEFTAKWLTALEEAHTSYRQQAEANSEFSPLPTIFQPLFNCQPSSENAPAIIALLQVQNSNGWTLGVLVARYRPSVTVQLYIELLSNLMQGGVSAADIIKLLSLQDKGGWTFGMTIARYQDAVATQQYMQFLSKLMQGGVSAADIIKLLTLQTIDIWSFGMFVARHQDAARTQQYMQFLSNLMQGGVSAADIIKLLSLQADGGWTFGMRVARYQDSATTQQYIQLLSNLMQRGVSAVDIIKLLNWQNKEAWTFGIEVASCRYSGATIRYVLLLLDLMQDGKFAQGVYGSICLTAENGYSMWEYISADYCEEKQAEVAAFLYLISNLAQHGVDENRIKTFLNFKAARRISDAVVDLKARVNGYIDFVNDENGKRVAKLIHPVETAARQGVNFLVESANQAITFLATTRSGPLVSAGQAVANEALTLVNDPELDAAAPYMPLTYKPGKCKLS